MYKKTCQLQLAGSRPCPEGNRQSLPPLFLAEDERDVLVRSLVSKHLFESAFGKAGVQHHPKPESLLGRDDARKVPSAPFGFSPKNLNDLVVGLLVMAKTMVALVVVVNHMTEYPA